MAKQQFTFTLSGMQVREAIEVYVGLMVDPKTHDITLDGTFGGIKVVATKRRIRKPRPKVAAVKAAA